MVKIRLARVGRRNDPSFRIVVQDERSAPTAKAIEIIGSYSPKLKQKTVDKERAAYWLGVGAQPTGTVHNIFVDEGIVKGDKVNVFHRDVAAEAEKEAAANEAKIAEETVEAAEKAEEKTEEVAEEAPKDEKAEESAPEKPTEEKKSV